MAVLFFNACEFIGCTNWVWENLFSGFGGF